MKKGQNFRLFIGGKCVSASKSCTIEETAEIEDTSTKDSTGLSKEKDVKSKGWSGSADALVFDGTEANAQGYKYFLSTILAGTPVDIKYNETEGESNRTVKTDKEITYSGKALINDVTIKATVNEEITISIKFIGYGQLAIEATES